MWPVGEGGLALPFPGKAQEPDDLTTNQPDGSPRPSGRAGRGEQLRRAGGMRGGIALAAACACALSFGLTASPAAAQGSSSVSTAVDDAATNQPWSGSEVTGAGAYDTATLTLSGPTPTGTVTYTLFSTSASCTGPSTTQVVTLNGDGTVPNSSTTDALGAGSYSYEASYSGDSNYDPSGESTCEPFSVAQATPSISTRVFDASTNAHWSVTETTGATAYDTASIGDTVSGFVPTGTVTYTLFTTSTSCSGPSTTQVVALNGDGTVPNSATTAALTAGGYSFQASYSGDSNYGPSPLGGCEPFSVGLATSSISTAVFDAATNSAWAGTEATGATAYDTASVGGTVSGFVPTGTVTYTLFTTSTSCSGPSTTQVVALNGDGTVPDSATTAVLTAGSYSFQASYGGDSNYGPSPPGGCEPFSVGLATSSISTAVFDAATNSAWAGTEVTGAGAYDTASVTSATGVAIPPGGTVAYSFYDSGTCTGTPVTNVVTLSGGSAPVSPSAAALAHGSYSFRASYSGDQNYRAAPLGACDAFSVAKANSALSATVFDASTNAAWTDTELTGAAAYGTTASLPGNGGVTPTGTVTYTLYTTALGCTGPNAGPDVVTLGVDGVVPPSSTTSPLGAGNYSFSASYSGDGNYKASAISCQPFSVAQAGAPPVTIANIPSGVVYGGSFTPVLQTISDGTQSVTSMTPGVCALNGSVVDYVGVGTCTLVAQTGGTENYAASTGSPQSFSVGLATPSSPAITNFPAVAVEFTSFYASVGTSGDGFTFLTSDSPGICVVGPDGHTVTFVFFGTCSLTASVAQGANYLPGTGSVESFPVAAAARGYWLVGSDGGIFSFGSAAFHGSMGGIPLQRPVVGITPTADRNGYWLVASDGGIFSFGDSAFYGSIPGVGLHPAGSGLPDSLDAPIVGMVPSSTGHGYFMVASDGGVFAFGDAHFEGSCPGIGGCYGAAVSVMPDSTGHGYWLVTGKGAVYAFGDAPVYGSPPPESVAVVSAVATPDGHGYWILYSNGAVFSAGDAVGMGAPVGYVNSFNPATAIFPTADGRGYWVAAARGDVFSYGDAPYMGSMAAAGLNGLIIAGFGF